jgi:WD40 repeat protein
MTNKLLSIMLLTVLCSGVALAQTKPHLRKVGDFGPTDFGPNVATEYIGWDKYLEDKNQLLLIGSKTLQLIDLTTRKVIQTHPVTLPSQRSSEWQISPDGRRMLILGEVMDFEAVIRNPGLDLFLTKSYGYVKLFDSHSGELLQTLVSPDSTNQGSALSALFDPLNFFHKLIERHGVRKAEWSKDGKTLCLFSSDLRTVSLWELVEN